VTETKELNWIITNDFDDGEIALEVRLEDWDYTAYIKWDGCCEIKNDSINVHICDVPQFIEVLQSLEEFRMNNIEGAE